MPVGVEDSGISGKRINIDNYDMSRAGPRPPFLTENGNTACNEALERLARETGEILVQQKLMLVTAESCTGGWLGQVITMVAGSSAWYERGFITYSNIAKHEMLGVHNVTLEQYGAVSERTVREMMMGALARSHAQVAVSISGIAGPDGGSSESPVGTVCFAWGLKEGLMRSEVHHFSGNREDVRRRSVIVALQGIIHLLYDNAPDVA